MVITLQRRVITKEKIALRCEKRSGGRVKKKIKTKIEGSKEKDDEHMKQKT